MAFSFHVAIAIDPSIADSHTLRKVIRVRL
jgi:hypothetical protein